MGRQKRIASKTTLLGKKSDLKTPVTIITGFLGSGKTTLVNRILTSDDHGKRIVVIENEAGKLSIDDKMLRAGEQEKAAVGIFVMKNGCMCCTGDGAGPELERVLNHMLQLIDDDQYDYVLIETSGLADPAPIMQAFFSHQTASGRFFLDGVVSIVDAQHVWRHIEGDGWFARMPEIHAQIAHATTVVINKVDTVKEESGARSVGELEERLRSINSEASVLRTEHANVDLDAILDQRAFDAAAIGESTARAAASCLASASAAAAAQAHGDRAHGGAEAHGGAPEAKGRHGKGVVSVSLSAAPQHPVVLSEFQRWVAELVEERWKDLYRIKGVLHVHASNRLYVFQGVCGELKGQYQRPWREGEERRSELVLIGQDLQRTLLEEQFLECTVGGARTAQPAPKKEA